MERSGSVVLETERGRKSSLQSVQSIGLSKDATAALILIDNSSRRTNENELDYSESNN